MIRFYSEDWYTITTKDPNKDILPVIYRTKITKTEVIPLYRQANADGETGDIVCIQPFDVEVVDPKTKKTIKEKNFDRQFTYPFAHILPEDSDVCTETLLDGDMATNREAFGIVLQDGQKNEGWKTLRSIKCIERGVHLTTADMVRLNTKTEVVPDPSDPSQVIEVQEVTQEIFTGDDGTEYTLSDDKTEDNEPIYYLKDRGRGRPKEFIIVNNKYIGLKEHKAALLLASNTTTTVTTQIIDGKEVTKEETVVKQGHRGRVRVNPISPELENLFNLGHRETKCSVCQKDIVIQQAFVDKAINMGVDPLWLVSNYKCRSCGGVTRKTK